MMKKNILFISIVMFTSIFLVNAVSFSNDMTSDLVLLQNENDLVPSRQFLDSDINLPLNRIADSFQNITSNVVPFDYLDNLVKEIAENSSIYDLIGFSIGMVLYGIFVYHFYRFLSKRDMFRMDLEHRLSNKKFNFPFSLQHHKHNGTVRNKRKHMVTTWPSVASGSEVDLLR